MVYILFGFYFYRRGLKQQIIDFSRFLSPEDLGDREDLDDPDVLLHGGEIIKIGGFTIELH
jgi:hypothetical protein